MWHHKDTAIGVCPAENASFPTIRWENCLILMLLMMGPLPLLSELLPFPPFCCENFISGQSDNLIILTSPNQPSSTCSYELSSGKKKQGMPPGHKQGRDLSESSWKLTKTCLISDFVLPSTWEKLIQCLCLLICTSHLIGVYPRPWSKLAKPLLWPLLPFLLNLLTGY